MIADLVRKARTIRRFDQSQPIGESVLRDLIDAARLSPCGGNIQSLRYRIVFSSAECDAVFPLVAWAGALKEWPGPAEGERPTGYIAICGGQGGDADVGIAGQTIQLMASELGFGACMMGSIKRDAIKSTLGIPDALSVKLVVALGVPAEEVVLEDAHEGEDLNYYRTPDDKHHVPKLGLEDVLLP